MKPKRHKTRDTEHIQGLVAAKLEVQGTEEA